MSAETPERDVKALWRGQDSEGDRMSIAQITHRSQTLLDRARRRVAFMYAAGVANAGLALVLMWFQPALRAGLGYLVVTAVFLMAWVRRRHTQRTLPPDLAWTEGLAFYRSLLEHERDFHRDSARWFVIGPAANIVALSAVYVASPHFKGSPMEMLFLMTVIGTHIVVLAQVYRRLRREAAADQAELDAMVGA